MAKHVNTEVSPRGAVRWQIVGVTVHRDTLARIARQHCPARLARTVNRAKTEVRQREMGRWQIAGAVVRQGTRGQL